MSEPTDGAIEDVARDAQEKMRDGWTVFQKFSCGSCGNRLTMAEPNRFYREGTCDACGATTTIERCNYLSVRGSTDLVGLAKRAISGALQKEN